MVVMLLRILVVGLINVLVCAFLSFSIKLILVVGMCGSDWRVCSCFCIRKTSSFPVCHGYIFTKCTCSTNFAHTIWMVGPPFSHKYYQNNDDNDRAS